MKIRTKTKKILIKILTLFLMIFTVFNARGYDIQAATSIGGEETVAVNPIKYTFKVSYMDNAGNVIATPYEVSDKTYADGEAKIFSPLVADIEGYTYLGYNYELEVSGKKYGLVDGDNPTIAVNVATEDVDNGKCTFLINMVYTKNPSTGIGGGLEISINKINYTFNVKYIDLEANEIYDSYTEMTQGTKSTFSPKIVDITDYAYMGYYYINETGEKGINSEGSLSSLLHGSTPVITPHSEGKDSVSGKGTYTVYVVYAEVSIDAVYIVAYDANGGEGEVIDPNEYEENDEVTVLGGTELSRENYNFIGWNTSADGKGTEYVKGDTFAITANTTLYAQWKEVSPDANYVVEYDANGGEGEVIDSNIYEENEEVTVLGGTELSRAGYTFIGWNTLADGKGTEYAEGDTFAITANTTLYAQWKAVEIGYSVKYDANGGVGEVIDPNSYAMNDTVTVLSGKVLSREGYTFSGWNTAADGKGTSYLAGTTFTITEDTTLYAQWTKNGAADTKTETKASGSNGNVASPSKTTAVKTGDESSPLTYLAAIVMILGFTLIFITLYLRRKGKRGEEI